MHKLIVKPFAEIDATDATNWYNEKQEGLGDDFLLALDAKINAIQRNPEQFQFVYRNVTRALTERFPYCVFYIMDENTIFVLAILHSSRNPKIWKKRK